MEDLPEYFITSDKIDWLSRIEMQAAIQQHIDHSISSTINLPKGTDSKVVNSLYIKAWKSGLKTGIYYLRTRAVAKAQQFTIEPEKDEETPEFVSQEEEVCEMCSA